MKGQNITQWRRHNFEYQAKKKVDDKESAITNKKTARTFFKERGISKKSVPEHGTRGAVKKNPCLEWKKKKKKEGRSKSVIKKTREGGFSGSASEEKGRKFKRKKGTKVQKYLWKKKKGGGGYKV